MSLSIISASRAGVTTSVGGGDADDCGRGDLDFETVIDVSKLVFKLDEFGGGSVLREVTSLNLFCIAATLSALQHKHKENNSVIN